MCGMMLWTGGQAGRREGGVGKGAAPRPGTPAQSVHFLRRPCSAYKPLESIPFKNTFFRNLLRTLEIYYIPSAAKEEKLQVQKQPIFLAAENDAVD